MLGLLDLPYNHPQLCPDIGQSVVITDLQLWGDIDCNGTVDATDAVFVLADRSGVQREPGFGCPAVGDPITLSTS